MPLAITEDHTTLADTVADFLRKHDARGANRALLDGGDDALPSFWTAAADLGWFGLHVPEEHGGSGYGIEELAIVVEQLGRALTPGPFVPTMIASAAIAAAGDDDAKAALLPGLADGSTVAAVATRGDVEVRDGALHGSATAVSAGLADVVLVAVGDDLAVVERTADGVTVESRPSLDAARPTARVTFDGAAARIIAGGAAALRDLSRVLYSAEAVGVAAEATQMGAAYAKERQQFGRPIAMFQGVKHHCANMAVATELANSATWDAARAAATGGDQLAFAAAAAATLAGPAADVCANLNTQVHGGIAMTYEHDAHLFMRRATSLLNIVDAKAAARDLTDLTRQGVAREKAMELPPEAEAIRAEVEAFAKGLDGLSPEEQRAKLVETGYAVPHWPEPYGRGAKAVEQLVIEEVFAEHGIQKPQYGITAWNILTLIQYATEDQIARWVQPALNQEVVWCQLFSEPEAGSDAAGIKTKATRVEGGWLVNGQKVWTSGAHVSGMGFATVRTNPDKPKHDGITMMVIDMHAPGVEVRPIKMPSGQSNFNEVFFTDVFVPDDDVVGPVDGGWTVARATLGNESVSIGSGPGGTPPSALVSLYDAHPERLYGGAERIGRYAAQIQAMGLLNLRSAHRAVAGGEPGPEGAMTKLVLSELGHEAVAIMVELLGDDALFTDGPGAMSSGMVLMHRGMSIAGGTSEIKRNQIGERILGLPRDPLLK